MTDLELINKAGFHYTETFNVDWGYVSSNGKFNIPILERFKDKIDWSILAVYNGESLSEVVIRKFENYFDSGCWDNIADYIKIPIDLIEKHFNDFTEYGWTGLTKWYVNDLKFIDKYKDNIDWFILCDRRKLPNKFIDTHLDYMDWEAVSYTTNYDISEVFIEKYEEYLKSYWTSLVRTKGVGPKIIQKHIEDIDYSDLVGDGINIVQNRLNNISEFFKNFDKFGRDYCMQDCNNCILKNYCLEGCSKKY